MRKAESRGLKHGEGSVDQRGGRYRARWVDGAGQRRSQTFATEAEARAFLLTLDRAAPRPDVVTVADVVADYLRRGARRWSGATVAAYRTRADTHILPTLGRVRLDALTTLRVQQWVDALDGAGLAPGTVQGAHSVLSGALKEAVRLGLSDRNVATGVRLPALGERVGRAWTADEARAVLAQVAAQPRWHALYQLVLTTGLRPGEVRALRWADVDWDRARLTVRRTIAHRATGGYEVKEGTKTGGVRVVPLTLPALRALEVWRKENAGPWIFSTGDRPLAAHIWTAMHRRLCARAGVPVIRLHDLRHTATSLLLERGVPLRAVADVVGHKDTDTTLGIYAHSTDAALRAAVQGLADWLSQDQPPTKDRSA